MILSICEILCAIALWIVAYVGLRSYQYDHNEDMIVAKVIISAILLILIGMAIIK